MKTAKYKKNEIIEVLWNDAATACGWKSRNSLEKETPAPCRAVGYFCQQNKNSITIIKCIGEDDNQGLDAQTIPMGCVKKIRRISKGA